MKKRDRIKIKFNGLCAYTGKPLGDDWQIDHVTSKLKHLYSLDSIVGEYDEVMKHRKKVEDESNLFPTIKIINHYKRAHDLEGFRRYMKEFHLRLKKLPKNTNVPATIKRKEYMYKVADLFDITIDKPFNGIFYFETILN